MEHNLSPIALREGKMFLDGVECFDGVECKIEFVPKFWQGHQLGDQGQSTRWTGYTIEVTIKRRKATSWGPDMVKDYIKTRRTPEFTIQGISDDPNSDYYLEQKGPTTVTALGCVPTSNVQLMALNSESDDVITEEMKLNAKSIQ